MKRELNPDIEKYLAELWNRDGAEWRSYEFIEAMEKALYNHTERPVWNKDFPGYIKPRSK